MDLRTLLKLKAMSGGGSSYKEKTATGNPLIFTTDLARPLKSVTVPFASEGGISGINLFHTGKNLFDKDEEVSVENNYLTSTGALSGSGNYNISKAISVVPGVKYTLSGISGGNPSCCFYDTDGEFVSGSTYGGMTTRTVTAPNNAAFIKLSIPKAKVNELQMEAGSNATSYEAYTGESFSVSFGETANAGSLEAVSGVLTITSPSAKTVKLTPVSITAIAGNNTFWTDTVGTNTVKYLVTKGETP